MSSLKGDRAAQLKRRALDKQKKKLDRVPKMEPNIRVKKINLDKLEEDLD